MGWDKVCILTDEGASSALPANAVMPLAVIPFLITALGIVSIMRRGARPCKLHQTSAEQLYLREASKEKDHTSKTSCRSCISEEEICESRVEVEMRKFWMYNEFKFSPKFDESNSFTDDFSRQFSRKLTHTFLKPIKRKIVTNEPDSESRLARHHSLTSIRSIKKFSIKFYRRINKIDWVLGWINVFFNKPALNLYFQEFNEIHGEQVIKFGERFGNFSQLPPMHINNLGAISSFFDIVLVGRILNQLNKTENFVTSWIRVSLFICSKQ